MTVSGVASTCIVFRGASDSAILVPLQVTSDLQEALLTYPASAAVKRVAGIPKEFQIDSAVSLAALVATPTETGVPDSRERVRLNMSFKVEMSTDGAKWHSTLGENISEGGVLAFNPTLMPVAPGRRIMLRMHLPGLLPIATVGVVTRIDNPQGAPSVPARFAVKFTNISREDADQIVGFIYRTQPRLPS